MRVAELQIETKLFTQTNRWSEGRSEFSHHNITTFHKVITFKVSIRPGTCRSSVVNHPLFFLDYQLTVECLLKSAYEPSGSGRSLSRFL